MIRNDAEIDGERGVAHREARRAQHEEQPIPAGTATQTLTSINEAGKLREELGIIQGLVKIFFANRHGF